MNIREEILQLFESGKLAFKNEKQICDILHIRPSERKQAKAILDMLEKRAQYLKTAEARTARPHRREPL